MKRAVVLLSGGLDSSTVLAIAKNEGYECFALGFAYGQRHAHEVDKAKAIAARENIKHKLITIDLAAFGGSALTDMTIEVPKTSPNKREKLNLPLLSGEGRGEVTHRPFNKLNLNKAKNLRANSTDVEKILWNKLRNRQIANYKFRRQEPLGYYIADFICVEAKIIIEVDGGQHATQQNYDEARTEYFNKLGYKTLRFWNNDILENIDGVLEIISQAITSPQPSPNRRGSAGKHPLLLGEGWGEVTSEIPITYVPARNTIFLSYALAYAEVLGAKDIFIGVNALDYSGYPDCRPEYIESFEKMANLATKAGVEGQKLTIHAPLINLTKAEIIQLGTKLGVDYGATTSCYDPVDGKACGKCDSCELRRKGFEQAGIADPTEYASP